jgi:hypothetical protein
MVRAVPALSFTADIVRLGWDNECSAEGVEVEELVALKRPVLFSTWLSVGGR